MTFPPNTRALATLILVIGFLGCFCCFVMGQPNLGLTNKICNGEHYPLGDPFGDSLDYVFEDMMNNTPKQGYNYYSMSPYSNNAIAYGHATCNGAISYDDCVLCLGSIKVYISSGCYRSIGAQVSFVDCSMRYENYPFSSWI